jgi:hypothetical protein
MVFLRPDFRVNGAKELQLGYGFALPRVLARSMGRNARRAQFSAAEAYSVSLLIFAIHYIFLARMLIALFAAPSLASILTLLLLPLATWIYFLVLYYAISLALRMFRKCGILASLPNNRFQSIIISALTTLIALFFLRADALWLRTLGSLWLGLLFLNLLAMAAEKLADAN